MKLTPDKEVIDNTHSPYETVNEEQLKQKIEERKKAADISAKAPRVVTPNIESGTMLGNGYIVIISHGMTILLKTTSPAFPWAISHNGESHYFESFFVAVTSFKEDIGL